MNYDDRPATTGGATDDSITDSELIQTTPIWEQRGGKKKKGFGRTAAVASTPALAETRTFDEPLSASPLPTSPLDAPRVESEAMAYTAAHERRVDRLDDPMLASDEPTLVAPVGRPRPATTARKGGIAPMAVAAGVLAMAGIGAAGWYATRDNAGVPELTPGSAAPATVATADPLPALPAPMPGETARTTTVRAEAPAATPARTTQVARAAPRARPAAPARNASTSGIDASSSAAIPATPQSYSGTAVTPAPAATPAPVEAAPPVTTTEPTPQPAAEATPQPVEPEPPM